MSNPDMPLRKTMCKTCPHREGSKYAYLRGGLIQDHITSATTICHSTGSDNAINQRTGFPPHLCRGARNVQIDIMHSVRFIDKPTDEAWDNKREKCGFNRTIIQDPEKK